MSKGAILWTKPLRFIHWGFALIILLNLFWLEGGDRPHRWLGYTAVGILVLRLFQGFFGAPHERFASFPVGPASVLRFVRGIFTRPQRDPYPGHNPVASWMYFFMWATVCGLGLTGWMMGWDRFFGDERLEEIHELLSDFMIVLLVAHITAMLYDSWRYRRATILSMFTGRREGLAKAGKP